MRAASSISTAHLAEAAEHLPVIDLLERLPVPHRPGDLADEQDHRGRILARDMDARRGVGGPGPAGDEADARPAGQFAGGLGHDRGAAFLAADEHVDTAVAQRIEHGQVALAGDASDALHTLGDQLVHEHLCASALGQSAQVVSPWR
jgi:hypothetical protein